MKLDDGHTQLNGISWTPGICDKNKYSLVNERADLTNALVLFMNQ